MCWVVLNVHKFQILDISIEKYKKDKKLLTDFLKQYQISNY